MVLGLGCHVKLGFSILSLRISINMFSAFLFLLYFVHFHLFLGIDLQNILSQNTSGTWSIVNAYVSKFVYFSHFGHKLAVLNMR